MVKDRNPFRDCVWVMVKTVTNLTESRENFRGSIVENQGTSLFHLLRGGRAPAKKRNADIFAPLDLTEEKCSGTDRTAGREYTRNEQNDRQNSTFYSRPA